MSYYSLLTYALDFARLWRLSIYHYWHFLLFCRTTDSTKGSFAIVLFAKSHAQIHYRPQIDSNFDIITEFHHEPGSYNRNIFCVLSLHQRGPADFVNFSPARISDNSKTSYYILFFELSVFVQMVQPRKYKNSNHVSYVCCVTILRNNGFSSLPTKSIMRVDFL